MGCRAAILEATKPVWDPLDGALEVFDKVHIPVPVTLCVLDHHDDDYVLVDLNELPMVICGNTVFLPKLSDQIPHLRPVFDTFCCIPLKDCHGALCLSIHNMNGALCTLEHFCASWSNTALALSNCHP
jgi:hypothetical protein